MSTAPDGSTASRAMPEHLPAAPHADAMPSAAPSRLLLWYGVLAPPVAWALQLFLVYYFSSLNCAARFQWFRWFGTSGFAVLSLLFSLVMLLATLIAGLVSWRIWRRSGAGVGATIAGSGGRIAFMGLGGVLESGLFLLLIIMSGVPNLALGCAL